MSDPFRTEKMLKKFEEFKKSRSRTQVCGLCKTKPVKQFKYWKIMKNKFPYDKVAKVNHILVSKRHVDYKKLAEAEKRELESIKYGYVPKKYEVILEATKKRMSFPDHFHVHLVVFK